MRKSRMHAEPRHLTSVRSDATRRIERSEMHEQVTRAGEHRCRRWVEPPQVRGITRAPASKLQCKRCQVCLHYFWWSERREAPLGALAPRAVAHAGFDAARTALTLVSRGAGDALRLETAHPGGRIE